MHGFENGTQTGSGGEWPVRSLYDGWVNVASSSSEAFDKYVTESMLAFPGGWVEARQMSWSNPLISTWGTTERCCMLNLVLSGWITGGSTSNLQAGRRFAKETIGKMWLVPPGQTLRSSSLGGHSHSIRCVLGVDLFKKFLGDIPAWQNEGHPVHCAFNISGGQIEWLLRRMYHELRNPDFATQQMIETLAKQLTVEIIRAQKLRREDATLHAGGLAPWRLRLIQQRLYSEAELPDLEELAALCDMTVRHLSRAFRAETGQTIGKQIETAMVERANRMLGGGMKVREVALALGYATAGNFAAAFRRATGFLPSEVNAAAKVRRALS